ncbi:hypothetical protein MPSEU_000374300 [Mayamaea pseudoterrestris]|nr:hypothetical protein MPSEU_000374300 [Mayamaea pseudoterrestris]
MTLNGCPERAFDDAFLVYVEISPLQYMTTDRSDDKNDDSHSHPLHLALSPALVKLQLSLLSHQHPHKNGLYIQWENTVSSDHLGSTSNLSQGVVFQDPHSCPAADHAQMLHSSPVTTTDNLIFLRSDNPHRNHLVACACRGFAMRETRSGKTRWQARAIITPATMVRIWLGDSPMSMLTGETPMRHGSTLLNEEVLHSHDLKSISQLEQRLVRILAQPVRVGLTEDAIQLHKLNGRRQVAMRQAVVVYTRNNHQLEEMHRNQTSIKELFSEKCLTVHSPHHGHGKTRLVSMLARRNGCARVHVLQLGPLLAKYGTQADAALEAIIHMVAVAAAVRNEGVCIILDRLDAMLPSSMSYNGDAASPVMGGIASSIKKLSRSLKVTSHLPFPFNNLTYNFTGKGGTLLTVRLCIIGIVTCFDNGRSSTRGPKTIMSNDPMFASMQAGIFRLPSLSAACRLSALRNAFKVRSLQLDPDMECRLPFLAASAVWVQGRTFHDIAMRLARFKRAITLSDFASVLATLQNGDVGSLSGLRVKFSAEQSNEWFASVGGNEDAKTTLSESLLLDDTKRQTFLRFGLIPPVGVLLYGPPGTGKTLLAKAVARILCARSTSVPGGAFVSISSQDIINSEVGSGEKVLTSAFETARANAPAVIFVDEFQALFVDRSRAGSGRLSSTLLQCMDDLNQWQDLDSKVQKDFAHNLDDRILVLAATNTPWMVDQAFFRSGRFDRTVYVSVPSLEERVAILHLSIAQMRHDVADDEGIHGFCNLLASRTEGFSGADIVALCREATVEAVKGGQRHVTQSNYLKGMLNTKPSLPQVMATRIKTWTPR